mmetsp:Transcript_47763/g.102033  ORF Transcript_47763/g.102033 Transcript_47763/m.102033 type:complete len:214 (-) Transcript_47763:36-677(-)
MGSILASTTGPCLPHSSLMSSARSLKKEASPRSSSPSGSNMFLSSTHSDGGAGGAMGSVGIIGGKPCSIPGIAPPARPPRPRPPSRPGGTAAIALIPALIAGASCTNCTIMFLPASSRPLIAACASLASLGLTKVTYAMPSEAATTPVSAICTSTSSPKGEKTSRRSDAAMCGCRSLTISFVGSGGAFPPIMALAAATFLAACARRFFSAMEA